MKRFQNNQRVQITNPEYGQLSLCAGTVRRLRGCDDGAWVEMDCDLPKERASFPDTTDSRHRHIILYPEDCTELCERVTG